MERPRFWQKPSSSAKWKCLSDWPVWVCLFIALVGNFVGNQNQGASKMCQYLTAELHEKSFAPLSQKVLDTMQGISKLTPISLRIENMVKITGRAARMHFMETHLFESAGVMTTDEFSQQSLCAIMTLTQPNFSTGVIIETRFQALLPATPSFPGRHDWSQTCTKYGTKWKLKQSLSTSFDIVRNKLLARGSVTTGYGGYILFSWKRKLQTLFFSNKVTGMFILAYKHIFWG